MLAAITDTAEKAKKAFKFKNENLKFIEAMRCSEITLLVLKTIYETPEKWQKDKHYFKNQEIGADFWVCNGKSSFECRGSNFADEIFQPIEKDLIWQAYLKWLNDYHLPELTNLVKGSLQHA